MSPPSTDTVHEKVDPFSGVLTLVHTDLHLPGNGGLDLNLTRTYNSMIWGRRDVSFPGLVAKNEKSPLGIGWTMHMGIVHNPLGTGSSNRYVPDNPVVEMPDGSKHTFYKDKNDSTRFISKEYWVYKLISGGSGSGTAELTLTDGTVYTFEYLTGNAGYNVTDDLNNVIDKVGQVTKIRNAANTASITIGYYKYTNGLSYLKTITDSASRTVTLNYDYANNKLTSITVDSRTFNYGYTTIDGNNYLSSYTPPVGNAWTYGYETGTYELNSLNYPTGGRIAYTYGDQVFATMTGVTPSVKFRVVTGRTTSGRGITGGTWSYSYSSGGASGDTTTITAPGVTETHQFYGWGNTGTNNVWKVGLPISKSYSGAFSTSESYSWAQSATISNDQISNANWNGTVGQVYDSYIYVPLLSSKSITRDGKTYTSSYSSYDSWANPQSISESGDGTRSHTISYWTNTAKNIVKGKIASESVTGSFAGTASRSSSYDTNSGNVTQTTKDGVTTSYAYDTSGNLSSVTDANSHAITYLWSNGQISKETNSYYNISRVINASGTVASETNGRGYVTSFGYDGNLRPTSKTPPSGYGNATNISYPLDSSTRQETRGSYSVTYNFDGFGRPTGSSDSRGITTTVAYTAYGTKDYDDSSIGDKVYYDYFGRVKQVVHKDTNTINYAYSNSNTTITDENTGSATLTYTAFGNPDEKYLMSVRDQATNTTSYTRNIQGNVTGITQGTITRSYGYDATKKNFLTSETNQETGTITYGRDNVGNLTSKADASGTVTYGYDNINRQTSITASGNSISFGYDNANNRTSMSYTGGSATYTYDPSNRLTQKSETISGRNYTTGYGYDGNDNVTSISYPSSRSVTYGYNGNNQVTSVTGFGGSVTSVAYNSTGTNAGLPSSYSLSNGVSSSFGYNSRNLTTSISAGSALSIGYGYDSRGNTSSYTNNLDTAKNQTFGYDALSRINSFSGAWGSGSYTYDAAGNRLTKAVAGSSTTYGYTNNRVTSASGGEPASYSYSGEGMLTGGTWNGTNYTLGYDSLDNLTSYSTGSTVLANFAYDADGQRVTKTASGKATVYHYDQAGHEISENDGNGVYLADYVYLNGKLIAKVIPSVSAPNVVGMTQANAQSAIVAANLAVGSVTNASSGTVPAGSVISQTPAAGTSVDQGSSVNLVISTGPATVTVPNVVGMTQANAQSAITAAQLVVGTITNASSSSVPAGNVISQTPASGTGVLQGSSVNLVVSSGPAPTIVAAPTSDSFGSVTVNASSSSHSFTVNNTGGSGLVIGTVSLTGTDASQFAKTYDSCTGQTIASNAGCSMLVSFRPTSTGAKTATLSIPSNDPAAPTSNITLNGIAVASALTVTTNSLPNGTTGVYYSQALAATGGLAPYTWAMYAGSLPGGLTLSPSGVISGTAPAGNYSTMSTFYVQVQDATGTVVTKYLSLSIYSPISIQTTSVPGGTVGLSYSQNLSATGGVSPYTWSVDSGSLPAGLTLSAFANTGQITGTPTAAGTSAFTLRVTDPDGRTATAAYSIAVTGGTVDGFIDGNSLRAPWTFNTWYSNCDYTIASTAGHLSNPAVDLHVHGDDVVCSLYSAKDRNSASFWYKADPLAADYTVYWLDGTGVWLDDGDGGQYWQANPGIQDYLVADGTWRQYTIPTFSSSIQIGNDVEGTWADSHQFYDSFTDN